MTAEELREVLQYDPLTGIFTWKSRQGGRALAGAIAGQVKDKGYRSIQFKGAQYLEHRLAWLYVHGEMPANHIDHIDCVKNNNRICNLRDITRAENYQNIKKATSKNPTKLLGVHPASRGSMFYAAITINKVQKHIGSFKTKELAHEAYLKVKRELHPFNTL